MNVLCGLLEKYSLSYSIQDDWLLPNGEFPAIRAEWHPGSQSGIIFVMVNENTFVEQSFAGVGTDFDSLTQAFYEFVIGSFHVFLAAFWTNVILDRVQVERWVIGKQIFQIYAGVFFKQSSDEFSVIVPDGLIASIEMALKNESLNGDFHCIQTFVCNMGKHQVFEAKLDSKVWEAGTKCLSGYNWEETKSFYIVKNLIILRSVSNV